MKEELEKKQYELIKMKEDNEYKIEKLKRD